jgi:hypothetical protein
MEEAEGTTGRWTTVKYEAQRIKKDEEPPIRYFRTYYHVVEKQDFTHMRGVALVVLPKLSRGWTHGIVVDRVLVRTSNCRLRLLLGPFTGCQHP